MEKYFLKTIKSGVDFIVSLIPFMVTFFEKVIKNTSLIVNIMGVFTAIKNMTSCVKDIYLYLKHEDKDSLLFVLNLVSVIIYYVYVPIVIIAYFTGYNDNIVYFSFVALGLSPFKDAYLLVKNACITYKIAKKEQ